MADFVTASLTTQEVVSELYQRWVDVDPGDGLDRLAVDTSDMFGMLNSSNNPEDMDYHLWEAQLHQEHMHLPGPL